SQHLATMTFVGEKLPNADDRLVLSTPKDQYGFPLARITHAYGPDELKCFETAMADGQAAFTAAGAYDVWASGRGRMHLMGGVIMGRDRHTSVTNSYGQTHDIGNRFIAGASLFPSVGAVNPTFTIYAVTLRAAEYMLAHWASLVRA